MVEVCAVWLTLYLYISVPHSLYRWLNSLRVTYGPGGPLAPVTTVWGGVCTFIWRQLNRFVAGREEQQASVSCVSTERELQIKAFTPSRIQTIKNTTVGFSADLKSWLILKLSVFTRKMFVCFNRQPAWAWSPVCFLVNNILAWKPVSHDLSDSICSLLSESTSSWKEARSNTAACWWITRGMYLWGHSQAAAWTLVLCYRNHCAIIR